MVEVEEWVKGELRQIQEDGNVKETFEKVDRYKISDSSKQEIINAIENDDWNTFSRKVFEILTGKTVSEAKK